MPRKILPIALCLLIISVSACWGVGLPPNTQIHIVANADYTDVFNELRSSQPASVTLTVLQVVGVDITWEPTGEEVTRGGDYYVPVRITNIGNGADTLDLSVSSAHGWDAALVYDDNADGVHQADELWEISDTTLAADGYSACFVRLSVPGDAVDGDVVTVRATSRTAPAQGSRTVTIDIAPPGMMSSRLGLTATPESPIVGQTVTLQGTLTPALQEVVSVVVTAPGGSENTYSLTPASNGTFSTSFTPDRSGTYLVRASYPGSEIYIESSATLNVVAADKTATALTMQVTPSNPTVGSEIAVTGSLSPAMSKMITLRYQPPAGNPSEVQVSSDQFGRFSSAATIDTVGAWTVSAHFAADTLYAASDAQVTVTAEAEVATHSIRFERSPSANPTTVLWPETTQLSAQAIDSAGHTVRYQWSDGGAGGIFTPNATVASPAYLAPQNNSGQESSVTLTCTAKCAEDASIAVVESTTLVTKPVDQKVPSVLSVSPQVGSAFVELDAEVVIRFSKPMGAAATQQAVSFSPTVSVSGYTWDAGGTILTIRHAALTPNTSYTCSVSTAAVDSTGRTMASPCSWTFTTVPSVRFDPGDIGAAPSATFATPRVLVSDPLQPSNVSLRITVPVGLIVNDAPDGSGSLACVKKGADAGDFHSEWDEATRRITITASIPEPSVSTEVVKAIRFGTPATAGAYELQAEGSPALTVRVRQAVPGDFNGDGLVNITDAIRFTQVWTRWQGDPQPVYDDDIDEPYDLAPHTNVAWPNWVKIGDHVVDAQDSAAFTECWNAAHTGSSAASAGAYKPTINSRFNATSTGGGSLAVTVESTKDGLFEVVVPIPVGMRFDPVLSNSGSLVNVIKGQGAGTAFFSEYDPATRTARIAGSLKGNAPYAVATLRVSN